LTLGTPASSLRCASLTASLIRRPRRVLVVLLVAAVIVVPTASAAGDAWTRPVPGPVVRAFAPPRTRYGAGHLGADLEAVPGTPVRAAGNGTVEFAGVVANTRHVVVRHAGGLRTSYGFLRSIAVRPGERVARGAVVGLTGGIGENHDGQVLHLGLRDGEVFVDPMQLFGPPDLSALVRLAPVVARDSRPPGPG
jgi:murein DD-endopeptidase MepM/ murein hydrolase activator NlpD